MRFLSDSPLFARLPDCPYTARKVRALSGGLGGGEKRVKQKLENTQVTKWQWASGLLSLPTLISLHKPLRRRLLFYVTFKVTLFYVTFKVTLGQTTTRLTPQQPTTRSRLSRLTALSVTLRTGITLSAHPAQLTQLRIFSTTLDSALILLAVLYALAVRCRLASRPLAQPWHWQNLQTHAPAA